MNRKQKLMEANQLQKLIEKCLSGGGTDQDWMLLKSTLDKEEYSMLRCEMLALSRLKTEDLKADEAGMWSRVEACRRSGDNRLTWMRRVARYAALLALPLLAGGVYLWMEQMKMKEKPVAVSSIEPGRNRAILKLADGAQLDLGAIGRDTVLYYGGVEIRLDSARNVSYQTGSCEILEGGYNTIVVPRGGEYRLVLADGSVVWLNSDSELKYPMAFVGRERKVFLKGEAYFDVANNPEQPFVVDVAKMEVKVLGTEFNINAYREDGVVQTTLVEGKVEVAGWQNRQKVILLPDQQALVQNGKLTVVDVDASVYTAWRDGKFYFESESLTEIAAQLERWYDVDFFFTREELKDQEFTGVIRRDFTANQILDIIAKTTNVQFEIKGRTVVVK